MSDLNTDLNADPGPAYMGFWARALAFLIDNVAAFLIVIPVIRYAITETELDLTGYDLSDAAQLSELLDRLLIQLPRLLFQFSVEVLVLGTIFILFWIVKSATPGKMVLGCSIVDARTLGKASSSQNIIRYLGYFVSLVPLGLGFIWIGFDSRKQGWHDKMAGTLVIKGKPRAGDDGSAT